MNTETLKKLWNIKYYISKSEGFFYGDQNEFYNSNRKIKADIFIEELGYYVRSSKSKNVLISWIILSGHKYPLKYLITFFTKFRCPNCCMERPIQKNITVLVWFLINSYQISLRKQESYLISNPFFLIFFLHKSLMTVTVVLDLINHWDFCTHY